MPPHCNSRKCSQAAAKFPKVSKRNSTVHAGCDCNVRSALRGSSESGRGQPHSTTLARATQPGCFREVLECGCPLPLFLTANIGERTTAPLRASIFYRLWLRLCRAVFIAPPRFPPFVFFNDGFAFCASLRSSVPCPVVLFSPLL